MMTGVVLVCFIMLLTEIQFGAIQAQTICNSPQYLELGKRGIVTCRFHKDFFAVWWYTSIDFGNSRPTVKYQNKLTTGPGYESGEFDVHPNGSLIVTEVLLKYEDVFTVAYLPSKEELYGFINVEVIVTVKPDVPFPFITQCGNVSNKCFTVADEADIECSVRGVRPKIHLDFIARTLEGDKNISRELVITSDGDVYTSTVITSYAFHLSPRVVLLVCKAYTNIPGLFENTESIALVQNSLVQTIPDQATSITIQRYERMELHCAENENAFIVWKKAIPPRYEDYELLFYSVNFGQSLIEVFAEDIILENNVSLVLPSVDVQHEGEYVCFYGDGMSDGVRVYNVTVVVLAYPAIDGCNGQAYCELPREYEGSLTCSIKGIRPNVELQWRAYFEDESDLILFSNQKRIVKYNRESFDVTLIVQYRVSDKRRKRLTVECRVVSANNLLSNLARKMDLLFFKEKTFQSHVVTRDVEEEIRMLEAVSGEKRNQFLNEIKERYKDLYDAVKPIPYMKDKTICGNDVFVDPCITFKDSNGKWIGLQTYHNVFSDPRIKSERLLLEGEPGYGKSTLAFQYAYDWCNSIQDSPLKDVDILILLRLKQLGGVSSFYRGIKEFLLPRKSTLTESDIENILTNSNSVVIILDAFDEYPDQNSRTSHIISIIAGKMFCDLIVLLTTRPLCLPQKYSPSPKRLRLRGFTQKARKYYIRKAVDNNDQTVREIEGCLEDNPILRDLCEVPLLFVHFAHIMYDYRNFTTLNSATKFFRHMISCLSHHIKNETQDVDNCNDDLLKNWQHKLYIKAFKALREGRKRMVCRKEELCEKLDQKFYNLYKDMGILVEVPYITAEFFTFNPDHVQYRQEVTFCHKVFCEWYAAHYLSDYIQKNPSLDLKECLRNLHPVDVQYLYRFSCGLNPDSAEKIINYLAEIEGVDKFAILCIFEKTGSIENIKQTISQLCSDGLIISDHDSLLLQRSSMQLLEISAKSKIPVKLLQLHNCFESVDFSISTLNTTSGLAMPSWILVEQLGLRMFNKRTSYDEYVDILKFSAKCPSLSLLGFYGSPPPESFKDESIPSDLQKRNVKVKYYGSYLESPVYTLDLRTGQWKRTDGAQCTEEDFNQMESDWKKVGDRDVDELRRLIFKYREQLSLSATKGNVTPGFVNDDDSIAHGNDDIDIMSQLRIDRKAHTHD
ncbi:hypothetical protein HOLleu_09920 [Holothuria leucospilota]|uniref:NACHT domain-containing protein n=1 Tax=Holothuria leucospilota TaxID=206669 RepID=A0A9Q1CC99_HOLLE|nr:hypothetical protein HOLleu_09920 [Holothuria leucospilota]